MHQNFKLYRKATKNEKKKRKEKKKKEEGLMELAQSVGTNAWFIFWSMLPNLKNVDNCEVIIYLSGSYKKKIVFLYDIHLKLIEFLCVIISFLLFSNLLHH